MRPDPPRRSRIEVRGPRASSPAGGGSAGHRRTIVKQGFRAGSHDRTRVFLTISHSRIAASDLSSPAMQQALAPRSCFAPSLIFALFVTSGAVLLGQLQTGVIVQDAPLVLLPAKGRSPLLIMERGVTVQVIRRQGDWFNVTVQGSRWGDRTGYVEAKYVQLRAADPPQPFSPG